MMDNVIEIPEEVQPHRILVSGSRSLDLRRYTSPPPEVVHNLKAARRAFLEALEDAVAELAVAPFTSAGLHPVVIVHGAAKHGADNWADHWIFAAWDSRRFSRAALHVERWPAEWHRRGKFRRGAGMERNGDMIATMDRSLPHVVLACWDGDSRGTQNIIDRATVAGLRIVRCWK